MNNIIIWVFKKWLLRLSNLRYINQCTTSNKRGLFYPKIKTKVFFRHKLNNHRDFGRTKRKMIQKVTRRLTRLNYFIIIVQCKLVRLSIVRSHRGPRVGVTIFSSFEIGNKTKLSPVTRRRTDGLRFRFLYFAGPTHTVVIVAGVLRDREQNVGDVV